MNTPARLGLYVAGLLVAFGAAAGVGAAAGPIDVGGDDHEAEHAAGHEGAAVEPAKGLRLAANLAATPAGEPFHYMFTVEGPDGPVVDFAELHERRLHLIVVSGDLVDYWHLHPEMTADGAWHIEMPALAAGVYVVYADFQPVGGEQITLQQRITVTADDGSASARALPAPATTTSVDGFDVELSGTVTAGESTLQFDVSRDGQAVTTEPYLGAAGHLVAIRAADLDYLHVHPLGDGAPAVRFAADLPAAGTYRLFFDFAVDGTVHTASFTLEVPAAGAGTAESPAPATPHTDATHEEHGS